MKITSILFAAALLGAGSLQAQETPAHHYMIQQAQAYGEIIQVEWRGLGLSHEPRGVRAVREMVEMAYTLGYTNQQDLRDYVQAAQAAAYKYDADLNAAVQQQLGQ